MCLGFDVVEGVAFSLDFLDDGFCGGFPGHGFGIKVPVLCHVGDGIGEGGDVAERSAAWSFIGEFFEPSLDGVQPGTRGRREVQMAAATIPV